jgi:hypothetical protein
MENASIFYGHLEYFTVIWYILWPFGNVVVIWYILSRFGILRQKKSGNPAAGYRAMNTPHTMYETYLPKRKLAI